MASEKSMRQRVVRALKSLDAMSVENSVRPGTPDVEYIGGWIELKSAEGWPKNEKTPLRVPHFSPLQRIWLSRRCNAGGLAWLLIRVGREWLLLRGDVAAKILGSATREQLLEACSFYWETAPSDEELLRAVRL
jgi:hypothetical protein